MASNQIVPFKDRFKNVAGLLEKKRNQFGLALPKHITVDRMLGVALRSIQKTPKLLECDQHSLISSIMQSAQMGLECDGVLGQAYLVPFKGKVVLVPGYKGLIKLARNSGEISTIQAHEVYANDKFVFHYGLDPVLEHTPTSEADPGQLVAFYAVCRLKDGSTQFEVMWRKQVDRIRDGSQGYQAAKKYNSPTPWDDHYAEMGKKTVLRRLCKMLPASTELARAVTLDEQAEAGLPQEFDIDITPEDGPGNGGGSKLDQVVDAAKEATATAPTSEPQPSTEQPKPKTKATAPKATEPNKAAGNPSYSDHEEPPDLDKLDFSN